MLSDLSILEKEIESFSVANKEELENFRIKYLSRNGLLTKLFEDFKQVSKEERPAVGKKLNDVKKLAEKIFDDKRSILESASKSTEEIDLTLPGRTFSIGREHILIKTLNEFVNIFREIGFKVADGPEIEEEFYNFDALNTPAHHPSRDIQDTYYIKKAGEDSKQYLLRTHTSPIQVRTMMDNKPPIRIVSPGKVYRSEAVTVKNYFMFHQVEGLFVDKNVSMRDLKGALSYFVRRFYGKDIKTRFRPS